MPSPLISKAISVLLAVSVCLSPLGASAQDDDPLDLDGLTPVGTWISESGDSTYEVTLCGEGGVSLCGRLIWIREKERNARNEVFIGEWMVHEAPRTGSAEWKDRLNILGREVDGTVRQVSMNEVRVTGCIYFILCESVSLYRTHNPDGSPVDEAEEADQTA